MDVQEQIPEYQIPLERVGVTNVRKLVVRQRKGEKGALSVKIDAFVDVLPNKKGAHMSRCVESINEVIESVRQEDIEDLELFAGEVAARLLSKNDDATKTEVKSTADYPIIKKSPKTKKLSQEMYKLVSHATAYRIGGEQIVRHSIGVIVEGMTACPCAQDMMRSRAEKSLMELVTSNIVTENTIKEILRSIPMPTHNQRARAELSIDLPHESIRIEANDMINLVEMCFSSPIYEVLKRPDEELVVYTAHLKPQFVEDCVREIVAKCIERFPDLPDDALIRARVESFESIHRHNAVAQCSVYVEELRESKF